MPIYEYQCQECGETQEELVPRPVGPRDRLRCRVCGGDAPPTVSRPRVQTWKPLFLEHVCPEGKLFETKRALKDYCREHGLESNALL